MARVEQAWDEVGKTIEALGLKLKLHAEQITAPDKESLELALQGLKEAAEKSVDALGRVVKDDAIRDNVVAVGKSVADAVAATVTELKERLTEEFPRKQDKTIEGGS